MPLCERCHQKSDRQGHSYPINSLKNSTCEFCRLVYEGVVAVLSPIRPKENATVSFPAFTSHGTECFMVVLSSHGSRISFWCSWGTICPWGILTTHRDITSLESGGEGSFKTAIEWIRNCIETHNCGGTNIQSTLPTRVVDTGLRGSLVRVVNGAPKKDRYVCLSHCWGKEQPLMTTTQTLLSYSDEIPWMLIPATFRDAITVARRLEVEYIWIDSLCIIQDSMADWERESSKMADIYRNSYVTIAATSSSDSRGGLYLDHPRQKGADLKGMTTSGKPYSIRVQCAMIPYSWPDRTTPKGNIRHPNSATIHISDVTGTAEKFPLLDRGWVFQERLLSPRFLQFGQDELLWDCRESMLCECSQRPPDLPYNQVSMAHTNDELLGHKWRKIVEFYTSLKLTYQTDRLPALSGLAKRMGERRPGATYLAGVWSDSLDLDLLWIPWGPENRQSEDDYIGPSWSWSSSDRKIIFPSVWRSHEEKPSVKVVDKYFELLRASCVQSSMDPTGRVRDGRLTLTVPSLCLLTLGPGPNTAGTDLTVQYRDTPFFLVDDNGTDSLRGNWRLPFEKERRRVFLDSSASYDRLTGKLYSSRLARAEILVDSGYFLLPDWRETIQVEFSLLLEQVDECSRTFRRIGVLADGRIINGHNGDAESWVKDPSCFEVITDRTQITII
ncbi:HET-domain-containing protein [Biscogniauxia marginata]|nr:HET-domain-containing protein [Biscogniauxia marginata]